MTDYPPLHDDTSEREAPAARRGEQPSGEEAGWKAEREGRGAAAEAVPRHDAPGERDKSQGEPETRDRSNEQDKPREGGEAPPADNRQDEQNTDGERAPIGRGGKWALVATGVAIVLLLGWGGYEHWQQYSTASETQKQTKDFVPTVRTAVAKPQDEPTALLLPGQTEPYETASIFARATTNLQRTSTLSQQGYETAQNLQTQQTTTQTQTASLTNADAGVKVAEANVRAQQATIDRLQALTAFENVEAPFDGVVTSRNVEVGDLISADAGSGTPLFTMDREDILRVAVAVPQSAALGVRDGLEARIIVPEMPNRSFYGKVARSSDALLYSTRTLTTEVDLPNPDDVLRAGLFVDVSFMIPRTQPSVVVPADALIFDQSGMQVAVVDGDHVDMKKIDIYRDLGTSVEVRNGLTGGDKVVPSPPVDLQDKAKVNIAQNGPSAAPPTDGDKKKEASATN